MQLQLTVTVKTIGHVRLCHLWQILVFFFFNVFTLKTAILVVLVAKELEAGENSKNAHNDDSDAVLFAFELRFSRRSVRFYFLP